MTPIAQWLRDSRLAQTHPETGRVWSQEYLVGRITEETGWKLYRSNYVQYEAGNQTPTAETLQRFVDFWARYGIAAPDLTPPAPAMSLEERAVIAAERQAEVMTQLVEELRQARVDRQELADLRTVVDRLVAGVLGAGVPAGQPTQPAPRG